MQTLAFGEALGSALPIFEPVAQALLNGDILGAFAALGGMTLTQETWKKFISLGVKYGFFSKMANTIPFKTEFSFFGIKIKLV